MRPLRVLCVASGGGHLEQLLACIDALTAPLPNGRGSGRGHRITLGIYEYSNLRGFRYPGIERVRSVKFMGFAGLAVYASLLVGLFQWAWIFLTEHPDVVLTTGAEVGIVPLVLARLTGRRAIFIETAARLEQPSGTGKVAYPFCTHFFVQSEAMLEFYGPKARYVGSLL